MILSIDLSPVLKRTYSYNNIEKEVVNIVDDFEYEPSGDGIQLAYLMNNLNENALVSGIIGGIGGEYIKNTLGNDDISHSFFPIKDEISDLIVIPMNNDILQIKTRGPRITMDEVNRFLQFYNELANNVDTICLFGGISNPSFKDIYYNIVSINNKRNKRTLMAVESEELQLALDAKPNVVLIDKVQLEDIMHLSLDYEYEIIKAGKYIIDKGIKTVIIPMLNGSSIAITNDNTFRIDYEGEDSLEIKIDKGNMLGGLAFGFERNYDFEMILKLGQACGISNYIGVTKKVDMSDIKRIMGNIKISAFNN